MRMITRKVSFLFILVILLLAVSVSDRRVWASGYTNVTAEQSKVMIDSNPLLVILDVRNQSEYDSGHIRNARLIPLSQLESRLGELDQNRVILVYCQTGGRSASASQILASNNFTQVYNMQDGIAAWLNAGYPVYVRYSSLQGAINNATANAIIRVSARNYTENITIDKPIVLEGENKTTTVISHNASYYTITLNADNVRIRDFTVKNGYYAIFCSAAHFNITIENNIISDNKVVGVSLVGSGHSVRNNVIANNNFGVLLGNYGNNTIANNTIVGNSATGVELRNSKNNVIANNTVLDNFVGVRLYTQSDNNTITKNNITNGLNGISIHDAHWSRITENSVKNNAGVGISLFQSHINAITRNDVSYNTKGYFLSFSNNNTVYHNNIINNSLQLENRNSTNKWDNGFLEGNYWNDYNGTDSDANGIGDTFLPWHNVDYYPLMSPFVPGDLNHDGTVDWLDADLLTDAWQSLSGAVNYNPHADFNMDGIVNIKDATTIGLNWLKEWQG